MYLIGKCITGAAAACACGVTPLNHESIDDAMEDYAIVEVFPGKLDEVGNGVRRLLFEELDREVSQRRFKMCIGTGLHFSIVAFLM